MSFDASALNFYDKPNDNLLTKETINKLNDQINSSSLGFIILSFIKSYWYVIFFIVVIIILIKLYKLKHKEHFNMEQPMNYKDLMNNQSEFGRPTFNPYHPLDVNVNYTHDLGSDPKFNGVYNNNVSDIDYQPMEFLGAFDSMTYDFPNTRDIINTNPSYTNHPVLSDKDNNQYKKVNQENLNDLVKITYKRNNLDQY